MHLRAGRRSPIWFTNTSTIACSIPRICGDGRQSEVAGVVDAAGAGWRGAQCRAVGVGWRRLERDGSPREASAWERRRLPRVIFGIATTAT